MKQFSTKIMICPVSSLPETIQPPFDGFDTLYSNIEIKPDLKERKTPGGKIIDFKLRAVFSGNYKSVMVKYGNFMPFKLILFSTDGYYYIFEDQMKATIDPISFAYEFNISRTMLSHPF